MRPDLWRRYPVTALEMQQSRVFKIYGIGESAVMERLRRLLDATRDEGVRFGFYPRDGEVHVVIKAIGREEATRVLLDRLSGDLKNLLGTDLYGTGEDTLPAKTGALLKLHNHSGDWGIMHRWTDSTLSDRGFWQFRLLSRRHRGL